MGLEILNGVLEEACWDQLDPVLPSCFSVSLLHARRRKQRDIKRAAAAPNIAPGKKPAAMASPVKEGHEAASPADAVGVVDFSDDGEATGVMVVGGSFALVAIVDDGDDVRVEDVDMTAVAVVDVLLFRIQVLSPWQV